MMDLPVQQNTNAVHGGTSPAIIELPETIPTPSYIRVQGWIDKFYGNSNGESLASRLKREINQETVFEFIRSENFGIRSLALVKMKEWCSDLSFTAMMGFHLETGEKDLRRILLRALSFLPTHNIPTLVTPILNALDDKDVDVQAEAARVVCYRLPKHAARVLGCLNDTTAPRFMRSLCLSGNTDLIDPILERCHFPKTSPTIELGYLLTPEWLAAKFEKAPDVAISLMRTFGYITREGSCSDEMLMLLSQGLHFVTEEMRDGDELHERRKKLNLALFPFTHQELRDTAPRLLDHEDALDRAILISEVRASDRCNIDTYKQRNPFNTKYRYLPIVTRCVHARADFCELVVFKEGLDRARALHISIERHGEFLLDWTSMLLVMDEEASKEAQVFLSAKWHALKVLPPDFHDEIVEEMVFPVSQDYDCEALKHIILGPRLKPRVYIEPQLSFGAASVARLAEYLSLDGVQTYLKSAEQAVAPKLLPIGVELQVLFREEDYSFSLPWKQTLRYFDIKSPRRPEFGATVEAAFRPAHAFMAPAIGITLLHQCGIFPFSQDSAIHISLQGDLGPEAGYLLFLQEFTRESRTLVDRTRNPFKQMARLMSKGFICKNRDAEPCHAGEAPEYRTEMRGFRFWYEDCSNGGKISLNTLDDLAAIQLLGSALISKDRKMHEVWHQFKEAIEKFADSFGHPAISELLNSNWYESTGEPDDPKLVEMLPIIRKREEVRALLPKGDERKRIRAEAIALRNSFATLAWHSLEMRNGEIRVPHGMRIVSVAGGVPLALPQFIAEQRGEGFLYANEARNPLFQARI